MINIFNGFPDNINKNLQQALGIMTISMLNIISRAKNQEISEPGVTAGSLKNRHIRHALFKNTEHKDFKGK